MPARKYLCSLLAVALLTRVVPVMAHDDDDDDEDHHHHHRYYERRYEEQRYYYEPVVVAPAPVYVYQAPPPVVVYPSAPPSVVYQHEGADAAAPFVFGAIVGGVLGAAASRR